MGRARRSAMVTESLERRRLLASVYAQDFGFGVAGHADAPADQLVAPLPGGRTLVVGTHVTRRFVGGDTEEDRNTIVSRINADGVVDATVNLQETQAVAFLAGHLYVASETVPVGEAICRYDA